MTRQRFRIRLAVFASIVAGFLTLFGLTLALATRAEAYVYWTNSGADTIGRANLDGTGVDQTFITGLRSPEDVAVNATHIYWLDAPYHYGAIGRAKLDGTGVDKNFIGPVDDVTTERTGVAVDATHIYTSFYYEQEHSNGGCDPPTAPFCEGHGYIARGQLDDLGKKWAAIQLDTEDHPASVAVDGAHVYWANGRFSGDTIARANLDLTGVDKNFIGGVDAGDVTVDDAHVTGPTARSGGPTSTTRRWTRASSAAWRPAGWRSMPGTSTSQTGLALSAGSAAPTSTAPVWTRASSLALMPGHSG